MPAHQLSRTRDPDGIAATAIALRMFGAGNAPQTGAETEYFDAFARAGLSVQAAKQMADRFYARSAPLRRRHLGPLAEAGASLPATPVRGEVGAVAASGHTAVRARFRGQAAAPVGAEATAEGARPTVQVSYGINYKGMHCVDETGPDFPFSDEVYIITSVVHIEALQPGQSERQNIARTTRHPFGFVGRKTYGDVDSRETRIGPEVAIWDGQAGEFEGGVSVTCVFMERDKGDPDFYRDEVENVVKLAIAGVAIKYPALAPLLKLEALSETLTDLVNWFLPTDDDEIGHVTMVIDQADLEGFSRAPLTEYVDVFNLPAGFGNTRQVRRPTGLMYHFLASVNDNDYFAGFEVVRTPQHPRRRPDLDVS